MRRYWDTHIHDLEISTHAPGTVRLLRRSRPVPFRKAAPPACALIDFDRWRGRKVLDVGCGAGVEVVRFAEAARARRRRPAPAAVGADAAESRRQQGLSGRTGAWPTAIAAVCRQYLRLRLRARRRAVRRVRPGVWSPNVTACCGRAARVILQVYNRVSWLNLLSKIMKVPLEHEDAPVLRRYSIAEFRAPDVGLSRRSTIIPERFPVKSRLHKGWKGMAFNAGFVGHVQRVAPRLGAALRLAPAGRLQEIGRDGSAPRRLIKAHAFGNDFLLTDRADAHDVTTWPRSPGVCDRHRGIGGDGLMLLTRPPAAPTHGCSMRTAVAPRSRATACDARPRGSPTSADLPGAAARDRDGRRSQAARTPGASRPAVDLPGRNGAADRPPQRDDFSRRTTGPGVVLRVGNPQCVVLGPATEDRLHSFAAPWRCIPFFPAGTNVELADGRVPARVRILHLGARCRPH